MPLCFDKSCWMIVSMLAVLKSGGACVALDPRNPPARLQSLIEDVDAKVVISSPKHATLLESLTLDLHVTVVSSDSMGTLIPGNQAQKIEVTPDNAAFVVFTSGSTGKPKGITVEHKAFCTSARQHVLNMKINSSSRVLQFSAYTFDVSLCDIFMTLMEGGCVCIPSEDERMNNLAHAINRYQSNWICLTPTVASLLRPEQVPTLHTLAVGGEALPQVIVTEWADKAVLINVYGPSECTVWSMCTLGLTTTSAPQNIGRIFSSSVSWIADVKNHDRLVPLGAIGELLIEGPTLARGYLKESEKTAAAYIEAPQWLQLFSKDPMRSGRMYKTGDLVRYDSDGTMVFIGRKDTQVKVRGQRVELGEIEYHLRQITSSDWKCTVEVMQSRWGVAVPTLVAFICTQEEESATDLMSEMTTYNSETALADLGIANLSTLLAEFLPEYMIPSIYIPLRRAPLTSSGKTNRRALRQVYEELSSQQLSTYMGLDDAKQAPSTKSEMVLQELWATILQIPMDSIGVNDSFFRLGGDSYCAIKLVSVASSQNVNLNVATVFQNPTLQEMAAAIRQTGGLEEQPLSIEPFELLQIRKSRDIKGSYEEDTLMEISELLGEPVSSITDAYPCTPLQEGLMSLSISQTGTYIAQKTSELPAAMDMNQYCSAWNLVVMENPILRSRIVQTKNQGMLQVVMEDLPEWHFGDNLNDHLQLDREITMGLNARLTRYAIIDNNVKRYMVWTAHHAVYDGWSLPLIIKAVDQAYRGLSAEYHPPFNYFIQSISKIDRDAAAQYWKAQFDGFVATDFPPLHSSTVKPCASSMIESMFKLKHLDSNNITVSTIIRASWAVFIARHCGTQDVVFGATLNGRNAPIRGIDNMIGPTITTVPIRVVLDDEESSAAFLQRIQKQATDMIPFEQTGMHDIGLMSSDAHAACQFQNLLSIQTESRTKYVEVTNPQHLRNFLTFPLAVDCTISKDGVSVVAQFDARIVSKAQVHSILQQFEHVFDQFCTAGSHTKIGHITACSSQDELRIQKWNEKCPVVMDTCVNELILRQAESHPDDEAICSWDGTLSYRDLDKLSLRLARHLLSLGVVKGTRIPLYFEKSKWMIVAMLAVMRSGGTFVPLDSSHPVSRVEGIIRDVDASIMLVSEKHMNTLSAELTLQVVVSDESTHHLDVISANADMLDTVHPFDVAYILFTSGSTGLPKGVMIEQGALATGVMEHGKALGMAKRVRALQFASYAFDASITEILGTLVYGGCVCIPSDADRMENIVSVMKNMRIDWALLTPSFASLIDPSEVPQLTTLVFGGEAPTRSLIQKWQRTTHVFNAYGPTECTVVALVRNTEDIQSVQNPKNIGRSVASHAWVVDPNCHDRLSPIGGIGELLVEGPILAKGYLNNEAKTEETFVEDLKWARLDSGRRRRFYKTGDLVRYNEDGTVLFVGRRDAQIKLRGQRIEIGEIEHYLSGISWIENAVVLIHSTGSGSEKLVAILSPHSAGPPVDVNADIETLAISEKKKLHHSMEKVQDDIMERLPEYMIPSAWILLGSIPLSSAGKTDRRRVDNWLHSLKGDEFNTATQLCDPQKTDEKSASPMEMKIQQVWCQVLKHPAQLVGLSRPFLTLGGDSISAMQVVARCRAEGIQVTLRDILQAKTISKLALLAKSTESLSSFKIEDEEDEEQLTRPYSLTPIQQMFFELNPDGNNHFNQSFLLQLTKNVSPEVVAHSLQTIVERHDMLRTHFKRVKTQWMQCTSSSNSNLYRFRIHKLITDDTAKAFYEESQKCLDIENGPLLAADLLIMADDTQSQRLFIVVHHLVIDLVSWRVLLRDLETLLSSKTIPGDHHLSFRSWSRMQEHFTSTQLMSTSQSTLPFGVASSDYNYWGVEEKQNRYGSVVETRFTLDQDATLNLLGSCNTAFGTEPLDIMLAATMYSFKHVFNDRSNVPVFNEGHGREPWDTSIDLSETVGWFTLMCPVVVAITENDDIFSSLKKTKDTRKKITDNGWAHFNRQHLLAKRQGNNVERPEILFNYAGRFQQLHDKDAILQQLPLSANTSEDCGLDVERFALIEIAVAVEPCGLTFSFSFNRNMRHQYRIEEWVQKTREVMQEYSFQLAQMESQPTLSDFPSATGMSYEGLDRFLSVTLPEHGMSFDMIEDTYSCSPMQNGLLISQSKNSEINGMCVYDFDATWRVCPSPLGTSVVVASQLQHAWQMVVDKQPILRTVFVPSVTQNLAFDQVILKNAIAEVMLVKSNADDALTVLRGLPRRTNQKGKPPHRLIICVTSIEEVFCKLEINHALIDGTSISIILNEISQAYGGGYASTVAIPYSQYIDFIQQQNVDESISYWKDYLVDTEPCIFPSLNDGIIAIEPRLQTVHVEVPDSMSAVERFCEQHNITMSNLFMTAWAFVLRAYSGTDIVNFGYLASGRDIPISGIERAVGPFINMLVCSVNLGKEATLVSILEKMQTDYAQSLPHQHCSLADIQHNLGIAGQSLFNTVVSFQKESLNSNSVKGSDGISFEVVDGQDPTDVS